MSPDPAPAEEPVRVRVHTSLTERPLFGGVDMEAWVIAGFVMWTAFLVFRFSAPFFVAAGLSVAIVQLMRGAYKKDPYFLPILFRSLLYRRLYAPRHGATEVEPGRPSLPRRALPS